MESRHYPPSIIDRICELLEEGKSMREICAIDGLPSRTTVHAWLRGDDELSARIRESREIGFHALAEEGMRMAFAPAVANPTDPQAARLAFDAVRWQLGKLSTAFGDKPLIQGTLNVGDPEAFAAIARALEEARRARAGGATSTLEVDAGGKARPVETGGELAGVARVGGPGLGQDEGGR